MNYTPNVSVQQVQRDSDFKSIIKMPILKCNRHDKNPTNLRITAIMLGNQLLPIFMLYLAHTKAMEL